MDWLVLVLSLVVGFAALFAWAYTQNWMIGIVVLGVGTFVMFGTVAGTAGPGPIVENFFETVGVPGFIAAVVGAGAGAYAGDRARGSS